MNTDIQTFKVPKKLLVKDFIARYKKEISYCKDARILLNYRGKKLDESKTLGDYVLDDESIIFHSIVRLAVC